MTQELWARLKPLFDAAVEKGPAARAAFLATLDVEARRELDPLVRALEADEYTQDVPKEPSQPPVYNARVGLQPGHVVAGQFRIVRWLGKGGMGDVYEAVDLLTSEAVAIKLIRPEIAQSPDVRERFSKEVKLAHLLTGPNVCRIHALIGVESGTAAGTSAFLTMELLQGVTLHEEIANNGHLPWSRAREIFREVCDGVQAMHNAGIIHRDLKTRNVMLAKRAGAMRAVVMDFGLAREVSPSGSQADTNVTVPGTYVGTPASMAPEQFSGGELSPATDIYALGVVLYEIVTGRPPFASRDAVQAAISRGRAPIPASQLQPALPRGCDRIISKCLEFDPQRRYQTIAELGKDLKRLSGTSAKLLPHRAGRMPWLIAGALGALVLGILSWKLVRPPASIDPRAHSWFEQGVAALREGSYLQAAGELQQAVANDDGFALAHARLAEAWAELDYTGAAEHEMLLAIERAQRSNLSRLDHNYLDAIHATLTHDYAEASRRQQAILDVLPADQKGYGYLDLGRAQEKNTDIPIAVKSYEQAALLRPDNPAPYVHLGILKSRQQDAAAAEAAFQRAEDLYRLKQNVEGLGEVEFQRAHWANERGDTRVAMQWVDKCLQTARQIPSVQLEVRALSQLSNVGYYSGQNDRAIADAARAIDLARDNHLEYWVTDGLIRQGNAYMGKGDFANAEKVTLQALQNAQRDQHGHLAANAEETMASIRDQQGRLDEQIRYAQSARVFFDAWGFRTQAFETGVLLQRGLLGKGDLAQALDSATQLLQLANRINTPGRVGQAEEAIGGVYLIMQRYPEALAHFEEALRVSRIANRNVAYQEAHCADLLWRLGRFSEAEQMLDAIPKDAAAQSGLAEDMERIRASILLAQRRYSEALRIARHAQQTYKDLGANDRLDLGYLIVVAEIETGRLEDARTENRDLAEVVHKDGSPALLAISSYLSALVDLHDKAPDRAMQEAESARLYFADKGQNEWLWKTEACIAAAAKLAGNSANAAQEAKKALDTLDKLQQTWGPPVFQQYRSRPDIQAVSRQLQSLSS